MIPRILIGACAAIVLFLGGVHLAYTFFTHNAPLIGVSLATLFYVTGLVGTFARQ